MRLKILMLLAILSIGSLSFNGSAGCGRWIVRENTDYLADPAFDALNSSLQSADITKVVGSNTQTAIDSKQQEVAQNNKTSKPDISGKWLVKLGEPVSRSLDLILVQSGDRLQGYGSLAEETAKIPATATGVIHDESIRIDVKLFVDGILNKINQEYKMDLVEVNETLRGSYEFYVAGDLSGKGNAIVTRSR